MVHRTVGIVDAGNRPAGCRSAGKAHLGRVQAIEQFGRHALDQQEFLDRRRRAVPLRVGRRKPGVILRPGAVGALCAGGIDPFHNRVGNVVRHARQAHEHHMRVGIARNALIGADRAAGLIIVEQRGEIDFCRLVLQSVADAAYGAAVGVRRHDVKAAAELLHRPVVHDLPLEARRIAVEAAGLVYRRGIVFENLPGKLGAGERERPRLRLAAGGNSGAALVEHQFREAKRGQRQHGDDHQDHNQDDAATSFAVS